MGSRVVVRRESGLWAYERALARGGLTPVAGADEAGRGACAGPLVVAAVVLADGRRGEIPGLADSKLLTAAARDRVYDEVLARARAVSVVTIAAADVDRIGLHRMNLAGMRRSLEQLAVRPAYVLTDGFPVSGLPVPGLAMWKGDRVAACIAAASVVAKVTRDRIMERLAREHPSYGFEEHKGYCTPEHQEALERHGPCAAHRFSYVNVARVAGRVFATLAVGENGGAREGKAAERDRQSRDSEAGLGAVIDARRPTGVLVEDLRGEECA